MVFLLTYSTNKPTSPGHENAFIVPAAARPITPLKQFH
jgi:hypothetical protein